MVDLGLRGKERTRALKKVEGALATAVESKRRSDARRDAEINRVLKGEADTTMWIAQLYSDPASEDAVEVAEAERESAEDKKERDAAVLENRRKRSLAYFKVAIGRFRALYGVSTTAERDAWLAQLPADAMKIVTSCRLSPQIASAMNGVVGEAGAAVARGRVLMRHYAKCAQEEQEVKEDARSSTISANITAAAPAVDVAARPRTPALAALAESVLVDFNVGVRIYERIGHKGEVLQALNKIAQFRALCGEFGEAGKVERHRVAVFQEVQDFSGMIRASQDEAIMFMRAAQQAIARNGGRPAGRQWRAHVKGSVDAGRRAVRICKTLSDQGMASVFLARPQDIAEGGLESRSLHALSRAYAGVWETHVSMFESGNNGDGDEDDDLSVGAVALAERSVGLSSSGMGPPQERIPFDDPMACAMTARSWLVQAVAAAGEAVGAMARALEKSPEATESSVNPATGVGPQAVEKALSRRLRQLNLELGNLEFSIVMKDRRGWEATAALASDSSKDQQSDKARLQSQQEILKSSAQHLSAALDMSAASSSVGDARGEDLVDLKFQGQVKQRLASVATMQGDLPLARKYYQEASSALAKTGDKEGAAHCREFVERLPSGGQRPADEVAGGSGSVGSALGGFVQDVDGVDSDDDLGEDGLVE